MYTIQIYRYYTTYGKERNEKTFNIKLICTREKD